MTDPSISVSRVIPAAAERIFAVLAHPSDHPDVDGSDMLRGALANAVVSKVGDVFFMNMFNDEMGDYVIENHVVEFQPERRIVWEPVLHSIDKPEFQADIGAPGLHQWGWQLEPLDTQHTRVTEFYDCNRSPEWLRTAVKNGERWRTSMEASLVNLERLTAEV